MNYYEIAGKNYDLSGNVSTEAMLKDVIDTDQASQFKVEMTQGSRYYASKNDILNRDFREFYVDSIKYVDSNKSNDHIVNNLFKKLTDQKQGYICGKPFEFKSLTDDKDLINKVIELTGPKFQDVILDMVADASKKGREEIQPFLTEDGLFDFCAIPGEQVIYITDTTYQKNVEQAIRYYVMDVVENGETKELKRVEVWDDEKVTRYQEVESADGDRFYQFIYPGTYGVNINPQYHWYMYNTNYTDASQTEKFNDVEANGIETHGWGRVPMISLHNNSDIRSDLAPIKNYIDALDIVASGFINDLKDIQLAIWVLKGYEGTELDEFMLNLQKFKAIKLDAEGNASAEPKTLDIPKEARNSMLEWLERKIYEVGQGVDEQKLTGGSITNVVIKAMYEGLNIKSNSMITKLRKTLNEFMYFVVEYINDRDGTSYDYNDIVFKFNLSMLFNAKELIETKQIAVNTAIALKNSLVTHKTALKLLRSMCEDFEFDIEQEVEAYNKEQEEKLSLFDDNMGFEVE